MVEHQAFQELARGERTATALENQLSAMEAKIEALLAQAERDQQALQSSTASNAGSASGPSKEGRPSEHESGHS